MSKMTNVQIIEALENAHSIQHDGNYIYPEYKIKSPRYTTFEVGQCCITNLGKWELFGAKYTADGKTLIGQSYHYCRTCHLSRDFAMEITNMGRTFCQAKIISIDGVKV